MSTHNADGGGKDKKGGGFGPHYPYARKLDGETYDRDLHALQVELVKMQHWLRQAGERLVVLFEGRDAAGKGGTINRFTANLNPRGARVVALGKPDETERGQWYYQRYVRHLPTRGEIVFFDRSWYNRAGVERVMGFCTPAEYLEFMRQTPELERMLVNGGIRLVKFWLTIGREVQAERLEARRKDPLKRWKLSPIDEIAQERWDDYTAARDAVFFYTHTRDAPWTVVRADDKRRLRLNAIRHVLAGVPYEGRDEEVIGAPDPLIVGPPDRVFEPDEQTLAAPPAVPSEWPRAAGAA